MDGFTAYRLFFSLKLHFSSLSYDVFESRGAVKGLTREKFAQKKDSKWFTYLATKFKESREFVQFAVACIAYGDANDIYDHQVALDHYNLWTKHKQMSTRLIIDDLESIENLRSLLEGTPPPILSRVIAGKIHIETAVAINQIRPFLSNDLFSKDYLIFSKVAIKIKKLERFVKYDADRVNLIVIEKLN